MVSPSLLDERNFKHPRDGQRRDGGRSRGRQADKVVVTLCTSDHASVKLISLWRPALSDIWKTCMYIQYVFRFANFIIESLRVQPRGITLL